MVNAASRDLDFFEGGVGGRAGAASVVAKGDSCSGVGMGPSEQEGRWSERRGVEVVRR